MRSEFQFLSSNRLLDSNDSRLLIFSCLLRLILHFVSGFRFVGRLRLLIGLLLVGFLVNRFNILLRRFSRLVARFIVGPCKIGRTGFRMLEIRPIVIFLVRTLNCE